MISKPVQFEHNPFNPPQLVYGDAVKPLSPEAEALLQRVFSDYEQVDIPQELGGGFTQSRVLVAQPVRRDGGADLPLVLKVGPTWLIEQEQAGYTRYIRDKLAGRIELITVELSDTWGVLGYRLAGDGHFKHESLDRYCRQTESAVLAEMLTGRLFKRLGTLWQNADVRPEAYSATKYDLLLPVQLVVEPQALPCAAPVFELTPEQLTPEHLQAGDAVRLASFVITEVDPEAQEVTLDLPAKTDGPSRSHRLRLQPVDAVERYRVGEPMPLVEGRVVQTRRGRLQAEIDRILDPSTELELTADRLRLADGGILPNPLAHLSALLSDWPAVKLAYQHGDLNLENVLVDPATRDVTLIDFANAGLEHVLHDLLHLEMSVVTSLLAEALVEVGETPELIGPVFYDRLRRATVDDPALYTPPRLLQPALKKVYTILAAIRQIAQAYLTNPNDWDEYYRGLALYLVGALKFKDLDQVPAAPYPKQLALVGAAQAVALWQQPEVRPVPTVDLSPVTAELQMALAGTGFDLSRETLLLPDETSLLNPITQLPDLLESWIGTRWDRVHGRFDLATLVSELESDANALIEAEVGPDERLHHLLRLETGVVVGLLPPALIEADQPPETIRFLIYERLHRAVMGDPAQFALPRAIHPALAQPYALLAAIRRQTARFLTSEAAWAEYYRGLVFYLLGVLRLEASHAPPSTPPKGGKEKPLSPLGEGWGEGA
ncbi:MAG: phosphotransferase, partial [Anaerolineae bacterium]|nr:phosphotransferase [Anaerolineae bacterium]